MIPNNVIAKSFAYWFKARTTGAIIANISFARSLRPVLTTGHLTASPAIVSPPVLKARARKSLITVEQSCLIWPIFADGKVFVVLNMPAKAGEIGGENGCSVTSDLPSSICEHVCK